MIKIDEDALICDLAETYQIYEYRRLPARLVAVFSVGLREDSRIKMKLSGRKLSNDVLLNAIIADRLTTLVWFKTNDGQKNRNRPQSLLMTMLGETPQQKARKEVRSFSSAKAFEEYRNKILGGTKNG